MAETKSNFLILFFPDFRQILFLFIYLMHPCTWLIFCTVLTVSLMTGLSSFGALPQCDIVFTWDFSVFCHFIFLDSVLENYNGMKELSEKRKKASPKIRRCQSLSIKRPYRCEDSPRTTCTPIVITSFTLLLLFVMIVLLSSIMDDVIVYLLLRSV